MWIALKTYKRFFLSIATGFFCLTAIAQLNFDYTAGKFLIKGTVVDQQTGSPVPMANITIVNHGKGTSCDEQGRFDLYVYKSDSLKFSSTGYIPRIIAVRNIDTSAYYTMEIPLLHDFIKLREVTIYPYRDMDDFKKAFVEGRGMKRVSIPGIAPPKYSNIPVKPKFTNAISYLYERLKRRRAANPDFKP